MGLNSKDLHNLENGEGNAPVSRVADPGDHDDDLPDHLRHTPGKHHHPLLDFLNQLKNVGKVLGLLGGESDDAEQEKTERGSFENNMDRHLEDHGELLKMKDRVGDWQQKGAGRQAVGADMALEKVKCFDVNGLVGRVTRSAVSGQTTIKELESWRDFHLVDAWTRQKIVSFPDAHAGDPHLYLPRPMNMRTWLWHSKWRAAVDAFQTGMGAEAFLWQALNERCVDTEAHGMWSPAMMYAVLAPITLLCSDSGIFMFACFIFFESLLISVALNTHTFYWWARPILFPSRLFFLIFILTKIGGTSMQLCGYAMTLLAVLCDLIRGDLALLRNMRYNCSYEVVRQLPNQIFVCLRQGDIYLSEARCKRPLSEKITGIKDPGNGSLCLIANVQGVLVELLPVHPDDDTDMLMEEHQQRSANIALGRVKFFGLDLLNRDCRSVQDMERKKGVDTVSPMHKFLKTASSSRIGTAASMKGDMRVEDIT